MNIVYTSSDAFYDSVLTIIDTSRSEEATKLHYFYIVLYIVIFSACALSQLYIASQGVLYIVLPLGMPHAIIIPTTCTSYNVIRL